MLYYGLWQQSATILQNAIEGSGIGLYLVKEIISNAGGKIIVKSQIGEGTEFKVFFKI